MPVSYRSLDTDLKNRVRGSLVSKGKTWYVHATDGSDGDSGKSWDTAFLTMAKAFNNIKSGDTIYFAGKIKEQLTTPAQVFDVTIVGAGTNTRHADDAPANLGGKATATWTTPDSATAATPLVKVLQQGWRFENILFASLATSNDSNAAVELYRDQGAGDAERDSGHASFYRCRFASGHGGIHDTGGNVNVRVEECRFEALTGYCILGVGNVGVGQSDWHIRGNTFDGFTNGVKIAAFGCRIQDNTFTDGGTPNTTFVLNTSNGGGSDNFIVYNFFQTATANFNTPDVVGNATDVWFNVSIDATSAGVGGNYEAGQPAG
jgi:hypothetical protein